MTEKRENFFIEIISNSDTDKHPAYFVTKGHLGQTIMTFDKTTHSTLTDKGWQETDHHGFLKAEISEDQRYVLAYYEDQKEPQKFKLSDPPDPKLFELTEARMDSIIKQMKENGKNFNDFWAEYEEGTNTVYEWDTEKNHFKVTEIDIVVGSFMHETEIEEDYVREKLLEIASFHSLKEQGFKL